MDHFFALSPFKFGTFNDPALAVLKHQYIMWNFEIGAFRPGILKRSSQAEKLSHSRKPLKKLGYYRSKAQGERNRRRPMFPMMGSGRLLESGKPFIGMGIGSGRRTSVMNKLSTFSK
jgi:hypothetical protein